MAYIVKALTDKEKGVIADMKEIDAVGHRVLHGGASFTESQIVNPKVMEAIYDNIILGPLHNPANIQGIEACQKMMPDTPNVAVFDTAFHQTMPDYAYMYAVPYEYYTQPEGSPLRLPRHFSPLRFQACGADARLRGRQGP